MMNQEVSSRKLGRPPKALMYTHITSLETCPAEHHQNKGQKISRVHFVAYVLVCALSCMDRILRNTKQGGDATLQKSDICNLLHDSGYELHCRYLKFQHDSNVRTAHQLPPQSVRFAGGVNCTLVEIHETHNTAWHLVSKHF